MVANREHGGPAPTDTDMLRAVARVEELVDDGAADTGEFDPVTYEPRDTERDLPQ